MFKFLRKYNKWILAVGGTLLMIVFLIPQAIEGLAQSAGAARATRATLVAPDGRETRISAGEWEKVNAEFDLIHRRSQFGPVIPAIGQLEGAAHWFLLSHEARQAGLVGPPGASQISPEVLGGRTDVAQRAIVNLEGVFRLLRMYQSAGAVSDHRLRHYGKRMLHQVHAEVFTIHASADEVDYEPSDAELRQQLERFGDVRPGQGEMGFGYRLPDRLKIEWLSIPAESVRESIRASDQLDNVALRAHWMRELRNTDTTLPPMTDDPEIPQQVRDHLLEKLTSEQLDAIARFAHDQFRASRRGLPHRDGYVLLPEDWLQQRLAFSAIAQDIQNRYAVETPEYHAIGDRWLELDELDELAGIGSATTDRFGARPRDLYDLVHGTREFGRTHVASIQKGVTGPPMRGPDGSVYFFRILDVDASRSPRSIDEVHDQLVRDVKRRAHYESLEARLSGIEQQVRQDGMLATAMEYDQAIEASIVTLTDVLTLSEQSQRGEALRARPASIPGIGINLQATEAIIDHALNLPADVSIDELPVEDRVFAVAVENSLAVLVVRIVRSMPLTQEVFTESTGTIRALMLNEELGVERVREAFSLESLTERHRFTLHGPPGSADEEIVDLDEIALGG